MCGSCTKIEGKWILKNGSWKMDLEKMKFFVLSKKVPIKNFVFIARIQGVFLKMSYLTVI